MRFGRDLHRQQVPAWADSYIDYARLKVKIRTNPPIDGQSPLCVRER